MSAPFVLTAADHEGESSFANSGKTVLGSSIERSQTAAELSVSVSPPAAAVLPIARHSARTTHSDAAAQRAVSHWADYPPGHRLAAITPSEPTTGVRQTGQPYLSRPSLPAPELTRDARGSQIPEAKAEAAQVMSHWTTHDIPFHGRTMGSDRSWPGSLGQLNGTGIINQTKGNVQDDVDCFFSSVDVIDIPASGGRYYSVQLLIDDAMKDIRVIEAIKRGERVILHQTYGVIFDGISHGIDREIILAEGNLGSKIFGVNQGGTFYRSGALGPSGLTTTFSPNMGIYEIAPPPQDEAIINKHGDPDESADESPLPELKSEPARINSKPIGKKTINLSLDISFDINSDHINNKASALKQIEEIVKAMKEDPNIKVLLLGNVYDISEGKSTTDPNEPTELNGKPTTLQGLQIARAQAVANLFLKQGIDPQRVKYGTGAVSKNKKKGLTTTMIIKKS